MFPLNAAEKMFVADQQPEARLELGILQKYFLHSQSKDKLHPGLELSSLTGEHKENTLLP